MNQVSPQQNHQPLQIPLACPAAQKRKWEDDPENVCLKQMQTQCQGWGYEEYGEQVGSSLHECE